MLPDKRESSDDCVGPGKASRVSLFITGTDTGVGKTHIGSPALAFVARLWDALRWNEAHLSRRSSRTRVNRRKSGLSGASQIEDIIDHPLVQVPPLSRLLAIGLSAVAQSCGDAKPATCWRGWRPVLSRAIS
jgi:hypothetical protein